MPGVHELRRPRRRTYRDPARRRSVTSRVRKSACSLDSAARSWSSPSEAIQRAFTCDPEWSYAFLGVSLCDEK